MDMRKINAHASHSKLLPTMPCVNPMLAKPTSMEGPALALNSEKPICHQLSERPPRKMSRPEDLLRLFR